jgi:hypothetical protein
VDECKPLELGTVDSGALSGGSEGGGGGGGEPGVAARQYNPEDYADLQVSDEVRELFQYIGRYKPHDTDIETKVGPVMASPPSTGLCVQLRERGFSALLAATNHVHRSILSWLPTCRLLARAFRSWRAGSTALPRVGCPHMFRPSSLHRVPGIMLTLLTWVDG